VISICIPIFNQHEVAKACLQSIVANTGNYQIVIVDNGSKPAAIFPEHFGIGNNIYIRNEENLGFPVACNQAIKAATGDTIILLNNDCIVTQGWASRLLAYLDTYSMVGPMTNYCAGLQQVTIPVYQDEQELNVQAMEWFERHNDESQEVNWIIGFCMAFKKSLWEEIGPFDESLWPCSGEEVDFCMRAKAMGHRIGIIKDVYVHHAGSQTFNEMERSGQLKYQDICFKNDRHLELKWGKEVFMQEIKPPSTINVTGTKVNLGSGYRPQEGFINIDNRAEVNPDIVCDITQPLPFADSSVDYVRAHDILEHIPLGKTHQVIEEIYRVLKPDGVFESFTPDAEFGQGAFQDPFHLSFWVEQSWHYYSDPDCRALYGTKANFDIESIKRIESNYRVFHLLVIAKAIKEV
jgi:GT2 family glycosyltransferase/predicted SAM-dependent methyltransferase